jgi:phosphotriesterase-related protein
MLVNRREFLMRGPVAAFAISAGSRMRSAAAQELIGKIMTVTGPMPAEDLGLALVHEHVLVDFVGAEAATLDRYDADEVFRVALPQLQRAREQGVTILFECTPAYLGRDPGLLRRLSEQAGILLVTNTGYYTANGEKHVPEHARTETAEELAKRWVRDWTDGIDATGIRPGFIKIGVDAGPLRPIARSIVRAAALTHKATGLSIVAHTAGGLAAREQLEILKAEGVDPSGWIWVHAQSEADRSVHREVAARGAWVEFDGIGPATIDQHVALVAAMKEHALLNRVLLSQDAGWYHVGEPGGGTFRPYDTLVGEFLPSLSEAGFSDEEIRLMTVVNPREAFRIRVRPTA